MSLKERVYSVLVVSAAKELNTALLTLLPGSHYSPVKTVTSVSAGRRPWSERSYDYVLINSPLPDDTGVRFAIDLSSSQGTVVLLFVKAEIHDDILGKVVEHGVFTLSKPLSRSVLTTALNWMASARERLRKSEKKALSFEEKMEEIRIVNRAKWLLISELKMEEPQAHRYIEKQAMDRCISKKEAAQEILKIYS
jgi:response regulator NasT